MKKFLYTAVSAAVFTTQVVQADSNGRFPGTGSRAAWLQAVALDRQATELQQRGDLTKAATMFSQVNRLYPHDAVLHYNYGNCLKLQKDFPGAIKEYQRAVVLEPGYAEAYYNLGLSYDGIRDLPKAEVNYRRALDNAPNDYQSMFNLAAVVLDLGRYDEARALFVRAGKLPAAKPQRILDAIREVDKKKSLAKKHGV